MIEALKRRIAELLRGKDVSLALILDSEGRILWHAGRSIKGSNVQDGEGFPRSAVMKALATGETVDAESMVETSAEGGLSHSARALFIRSLRIQPVGVGLFLYVDSGSKDAFDAADRQVFGAIGALLGDALAEASVRPARSGGLSGCSSAMAEVRNLAAKYAVEEEPVLLLGETGVGKNRVAELIHQVSGRRGPFVVAHTPSIPEDLLERELFGHRRGAFTGATGDSPGLLDEAEDGTLLLDEIAELPPGLQAKLLRVVEAKVFRAVGEARERPARVRFIAATHRDLGAEVQEHRFRQDLFYRLSVLRLRIPPLRERPEDIRAFIQDNPRLLRGLTVGEEAWRVLLAHAWPGNVRELCHVLTRAAIEFDGPVIGAEIVQLIEPCAGASHFADPLATVRRRLRTGESFWDAAWQPFLDRELNRRQMTDFLRQGFEACGKSLKRLAADLNIADSDYPRFVSTLHKYEIHPRRETATGAAPSPRD